MLSVWKFSSRGSLNDVIVEASVNMDNFFVNALLRDVVHVSVNSDMDFLICC